MWFVTTNLFLKNEGLNMNAIANFQCSADELTVESVFSNITTALRRSTEGVLEAAKFLVQFESYKEFGKLKKQLVSEKVMAKSTISQYLTIGKCTVLSSVYGNLPPSFNSIYHLAKLEKKTKGFIEAQIGEGKLNRATKLEDIRVWGETSVSSWASILIEIDAKVTKDIREALKKEMILFIRNKGLSVKPESVKKQSGKGSK